MTQSDLEDFLHYLNQAKVKFLIVGGYAVVHYSEPRYTKDLDLWVEPTLKNSKALFRALKNFGAPIAAIDEATFSVPGTIYIIGAPPSRIDLINKIGDLNFAKAWNNRLQMKLFGKKVYFISKEDLILTKEAAGRPQDKLDLKKLLKRSRRPDK
jgi:predicted nucleotidyltransferase